MLLTMESALKVKIGRLQRVVRTADGADEITSKNVELNNTFLIYNLHDGTFVEFAWHARAICRLRQWSYLVIEQFWGRAARAS